MQVGEILRKIRKHKKMTQEEISVCVGITTTQYSFIESGKSNGSQGTLIKIGECLGVPNPIIQWLSLEESDVQEDKQEAFKLIKPLVDNLMRDLYE